MPNFGENTRDFLQFPIYYYDVTYSQSLPVRGIGGAAGVIMNGWDPVNLVPSLVHVSAAGELSISGSISASTSAVATAAAPSYVEGSTDALSMDLTGALRVTTGASGGLTDAQLRATPVPVSGTVTATTGGLTDTQLRLTPVPVFGTVTAADPNIDVLLSTRTKPSDQQHVIVDSSASIAVTGTFYQTTQPVSLASLPNPTNLDVPISSLVASNIVANVLAAQQLAVLRAGPSGFVPMETPGFLTGTG